jgi:hypothetical protein
MMVVTGLRILWAILVIALVVLPAAEFACDGASGVVHESQHAHATPGLCVLDSQPRFVSTSGPAALIPTLHFASATPRAPFVPPRG